jgi:hypothetical protein
MLHGLFLDQRMWNMDLVASDRWNPESYGVKIDLRTDAHNIIGSKLDSKYKFIVASEVWEEPMRDILEYLRNAGLKVFLLPRESMTFDEDVLFNYDVHMYKGMRYFCPDAVLAPSKVYYNLWKQKTKVYLTGHPKFNYCLDDLPSKTQIEQKYNLLQKKKVFFPSHPPSHYQKMNGKDNFVNTFQPREATLRALEKVALNNDAQVIVKMHPTSVKDFNKHGGTSDVSGITKKYYGKAEGSFRVFGDDRMHGNMGRDLLNVSDVVVGFTSTMLLEAALMKKSVVHTEVGVYKDWPRRPRYDLVFDTAFTEDSLYDSIVSLLEKPRENYNVQDLNIFMHKVDGKSCKRICEAILREVG